ncbi:MAG: hypothetical protein KJ011_03255 [Burkholderiaceae bacterium]|nr:hypothetical protein [Burkholderiaceae bacterium]
MLPADVKPITGQQLENVRQGYLRTGDAALGFWFYVNVELQLGIDALADPYPPEREAAARRLPAKVEEWRKARVAIKGSRYL